MRNRLVWLFSDQLWAAGWPEEEIRRLQDLPEDELAVLRYSMPWNRNIVAAIQEGRTKIWIHPDQEEGTVRCGQIFKMLIDDDRLINCVDLVQLQAIESKGSDFHLKFLGGKDVFAWRGVRGDYVPYLTLASHGRLEITNKWFGEMLGSESKTLQII